MALVIDGYNLIGATPDLSLADPKKEQLLVERLAAVGSSSRLKMTVIFDGHSDHWADTSMHRSGPITVLFTSPGLSADRYIIDRFIQKSSSSHRTVVTSDRDIMYHAKKQKVMIIKSEKFWYYCKEQLGSKQSAAETPSDMSELEVRFWMRQFGDQL